MFENFVDYISVSIAISAFIITIITYIKKQKSDQFRTALDISDRLEKATNELINSSNIAESNYPQVGDESLARHLNKQYLEEIKSPTLELLTVYEFFSFLVNNKELTNPNIIKYFKRSLILEVEHAFKNYPDIAQDEEEFKEIKELLKKWKEDSKSFNR